MKLKLTIFLSVLLFPLFFIVISSFDHYKTKRIEKHASIHKFTEHLTTRIPVLMNYYDIPGVNIALIKRGKIIWIKAYGYSNFEKKKKMAANTPCRVESISKPVTAWGIMRLVERGILDLEKPVVYYLKKWKIPSSTFSEELITVKMLLNHTSGMPLGTIGIRYSPEDSIPSLKESLSKNAILSNPPVTSFSYSNTGFHILELLIEELTGRDFYEYMKNEILIPLKMHNSDFNWRRDFANSVPLGYDLKGKAIPVYIYPEKASGGLFATVGDIASFITAEMPKYSSLGTNILKESTITSLYTPTVNIPGYYGLVFSSYGLGHFIEKLAGNITAVSHGGQGTGWMTHFHSIPDSGDGIVMLSNSQRSWPFFALVLSDWAEWSGLPSLGMELIIQAEKALWSIIACLMLVLLLQTWQLGRGIVSGRRRLILFQNKITPLRLTQIGLSIFIISMIIWSLHQDYLFIFSVFPVASNWLGISLMFSSVVLLLSALYPDLASS